MLHYRLSTGPGPADQISLRYSAKVKLTQIEPYTVKPGATMIADPQFENHVAEVSHSLETARRQWEQSVADYVAARRTFTSLNGQPDRS